MPNGRYCAVPSTGTATLNQQSTGRPRLSAGENAHCFTAATAAPSEAGSVFEPRSTCTVAGDPVADTSTRSTTISGVPTGALEARASTRLTMPGRTSTFVTSSAVAGATLSTAGGTAAAMGATIVSVFTLTRGVTARGSTVSRRAASSTARAGVVTAGPRRLFRTVRVEGGLGAEVACAERADGVVPPDRPTGGFGVLVTLGGDAQVLVNEPG